MVAFKKTKDTPAEQLLRMIEGPQPAEGPAKPSVAASPAPSPVELLKRLAGQGQTRAALVWRALLPPRRDLDPFLWNIRLTHRVLWVGLLVLAVFGAYTLVDVLVTPAKPRGRVIVSTGMPMDANGATAEGSPSTLKALTDYMAVAQRRNPFTGELPGAERSSAKTTKHRLEDLAKGLTVVGIDRGANPVALIEHGAQQKTYIVKVGDELNGMVVKTIGPEGVTVTYEGQDFLLQ